jgi:hypothetical protein
MIKPISRKITLLASRSALSDFFDFTQVIYEILLKLLNLALVYYKMSDISS